MNRTTLTARLGRLEALADDSAPAGALPCILPDDEQDGAEAARLRARGYQVTTFDAFVQEAI